MWHMHYSYTAQRTILCNLISVPIYKIHRSSAHTLTAMALKTTVLMSAENILSLIICTAVGTSHRQGLFFLCFYNRSKPLDSRHKFWAS